MNRNAIYIALLVSLVPLLVSAEDRRAGARPFPSAEMSFPRASQGMNAIRPPEWRGLVPTKSWTSTCADNFKECLKTVSPAFDAVVCGAAAFQGTADLPADLLCAGAVAASCPEVTYTCIKSLPNTNVTFPLTWLNLLGSGLGDYAESKLCSSSALGSHRALGVTLYRENNYVRKFGFNCTNGVLITTGVGGGSKVGATCSSGRLLQGLKAYRRDGYLNYFKLICDPVWDATTADNGQYIGNGIGAQNGTWETQTCPEGSYVAGYNIKYDGEYITTITLRCGKMPEYD